MTSHHLHARPPPPAPRHGEPPGRDGAGDVAVRRPEARHVGPAQEDQGLHGGAVPAQLCAGHVRLPAAAGAGGRHARRVGRRPLLLPGGDADHHQDRRRQWRQARVGGQGRCVPASVLCVCGGGRSAGRGALVGGSPCAARGPPACPPRTFRRLRHPPLNIDYLHPALAPPPPPPSVARSHPLHARRVGGDPQPRGRRRARRHRADRVAQPRRPRGGLWHQVQRVQRRAGARVAHGRNRRAHQGADDRAHVLRAARRGAGRRGHHRLWRRRRRRRRRGLHGAGDRPRGGLRRAAAHALRLPRARGARGAARLPADVRRAVGRGGRVRGAHPRRPARRGPQQPGQLRAAARLWRPPPGPQPHVRQRARGGVRAHARGHAAAGRGPRGPARLWRRAGRRRRPQHDPGQGLLRDAVGLGGRHRGARGCHPLLRARGRPQGRRALHAHVRGAGPRGRRGGHPAV